MDRPILQCVRYRGPGTPVLLIDEIDRADDEFEALLLEFLGEAAVTVPELGTFVAQRPPIVVLTSNRSRDLHDALRRRCLYHWIDYPDPSARPRSSAVPCPARPPLSSSTPPNSSVVQEISTSTSRQALPRPSTGSPPWSRSGVTDLVSADTERALAGLGALAKTPDDYAVISDAFAEYSSN